MEEEHYCTRYVINQLVVVTNYQMWDPGVSRERPNQRVFRHSKKIPNEGETPLYFIISIIRGDIFTFRGKLLLDNSDPLDTVFSIL